MARLDTGRRDAGGPGADGPPDAGRRDAGWKSAVSGELPEGHRKSQAVQSMFDAIADRYELCNTLFTLTLDRRWRAAAVDALGLEPRSKVLDVASGTGDLCRELAGRGFSPVGVDLSWGMLANARGGAPTIQADAASLPLPGASFDGVTSGFGLRNFADLPATLAEMARVLRPGGRVALLEVATPANPLLRMGHGMWFNHVVPAVGGVLSDSTAYRYLPRSVTYLPSPERMSQMMREAGFSHVANRLLWGGLAQLFTATRSPA